MKNKDINKDSKKLVDKKPIVKPRVIGIDWAKGSGMTRGDIRGRYGNVICVCFKTVAYNA